MPYSASKIIQLIKTKKDNFWNRKRREKALTLFHRAAEHVPAYNDFLLKNKIDHRKIYTFRDLRFIPPTSKKNYLRQYNLSDLVWNGNLKKPMVFTSTSGSTGSPYYFPRETQLDWEYSILIELFLRNSSYDSSGPVLVILGFGMGVWIGGLITYKAFEIAAVRGGYPVSIITPGINKTEIFNALKDLSPNFKETILVGYPPFIKDLIDEAQSNGVELRGLNLRILTAAESYTEKFRDYLVSKAGIKNLYFDTLNIYGTADIGAMAWETPVTILLRRLSRNNQNLFRSIFGQIEKTPTLAQYNPEFITFEEDNGNILLTGNNTIPLVRYAVGDHGGVYSFGDLWRKFEENGVNLSKEIGKNNLNESCYELPLVYIYERDDLSTNLYGLQIYPEPIREALLKTPINSYLTGKFSLETLFDKFQNQYLLINLELIKSQVNPPKKLLKKIINTIVSHLESKNSEYRELRKFLGKKALPHIKFWPHEDPKYFKVGIKQKWVIT